MSWAYQLVRHTEAKSGRVWYGVHEVFYTDAGKSWAMTEDPVPLEGDSLKDLQRTLRLIKHDIQRRPLLDARRIRWARPPWVDRKRRSGSKAS